MIRPSSARGLGASREAFREISVLDLVCFRADTDPAKGVDASRRRIARAAFVGAEEVRGRSRIADGSPRLDTSSSATEKYVEEQYM